MAEKEEELDLFELLEKTQNLDKRVERRIKFELKFKEILVFGIEALLIIYFILALIGLVPFF